MRTGSCAVQQGLTAEAATVVKQAVTLAKRRAHAQVTPLHVANTMLAASNGLLRTACQQSHSHPRQCKTLELWFNVALNRLPASNSSSPMLGPPAHSPSISNALVAAFKRAQAHQRRGSIENQQQPLLAVKIELEQLIISILDDPSVSRVMREAGFSSTQVKSNVEQAVSIELCSQNAPSPSVSGKSKENRHSNNNVASNVEKTSGLVSAVREEDVTSVLGNLRNQRMRSSVLVGECVASLEGVVRRVMERVEKRDVDEEGMRDVKFISLSLSAFGQVSREQVENKIEELRNSARSSCGRKGFILYVGDINWVFEYRASSSQQRRGEYCPVEHMIMEIGKLISGNGENNGSFCVMGVATFHTYMRCRNGYPSLQTVWGLHPFTIPVGSLSLSLMADSALQNESTGKVDNGTGWLLLEANKEKSPDGSEPSAMFDIQDQSLPSSTCNSDSSTSSLPPWLQQCKNDRKGVASNDQDCVIVHQKWNSASNLIQIPSFPAERILTFSSGSPSSSTSYDQLLHPNFWISSSPNSNKLNEPTLQIYIPEHKDTKQPHPSSNPNSTSSSYVMETEYVSRFRELNSENLKTLCDGLERKVSWQKDIIQEIVSTILQCRSGMLRRQGKVKNTSEIKEETWLLFQGVDVEAKQKIARELARLVFGSHKNLFSLGLSSFSSTRVDSTEDYCRNKRSRDEQRCSYIDRFADAVSSNPHRVFLVEDIEPVDHRSQLGFKRVIERGTITDSNGEEVPFSDAIIILSCESFSSRSRACSPPVKHKSSWEEEKNAVAILEETSPRVGLDLNISIDDDDDDCEKDRSADDVGLLESVDRRIIFRIQEL